MVRRLKLAMLAAMVVLAGLALTGCPLDGTNSAQDPSQTASVSINDQMVANAETQAVVGHSATLTEGGFITIHILSELESGQPVDSIRGVPSYLTAGTHSTIRVALDSPIEVATDVAARIHRDMDRDLRFEFDGSDDLDGPYTSAGTPVRDSAVTSVQRASASNIGS